MTLIEAIKQFKSVSIVGMAKNTGKTTCLNYVVSRLQQEELHLAITSIGVDGEERDVLYQTPKPRITITEPMIFITAENDYANKEFPADVLKISERFTPLGRLITARAKGSGRVVLSGPSDSKWLTEMIEGMDTYGVQLTLVDGALSRLSLASPAVTDAMILCTGAACSAQLSKVIDKTKFQCKLIDLEQVDQSKVHQLMPLEHDVWLWNEVCNEWIKIGDSVFTLEKESNEWMNQLHTLYVSGAVTDYFLKGLSRKRDRGIEIIVRDFTKLFIEPTTYERFVRRGGRIKVLQKAKLIAVCTNPVSPEGTHLNPIALRAKMEEALLLPVYDIKQIENSEI